MVTAPPPFNFLQEQVFLGPNDIWIRRTIEDIETFHFDGIPCSPGPGPYPEYPLCDYELLGSHTRCP